MMSFSESSAPGKARGAGRVCNICGKEGSWTGITNHIEANHLSGLIIPCKICGEVYKSSNSLTVHYSRIHRK